MDLFKSQYVISRADSIRKKEAGSFRATRRSKEVGLFVPRVQLPLTRYTGPFPLFCNWIPISRPKTTQQISMGNSIILQYIAPFDAYDISKLTILGIAMSYCQYIAIETI